MDKYAELIKFAEVNGCLSALNDIGIIKIGSVEELNALSEIVSDVLDNDYTIEKIAYVTDAVLDDMYLSKVASIKLGGYRKKVHGRNHILNDYEKRPGGYKKSPVIYNKHNIKEVVNNAVASTGGKSSTNSINNKVLNFMRENSSKSGDSVRQVLGAFPSTSISYGGKSGDSVRKVLDAFPSTSSSTPAKKSGLLNWIRQNPGKAGGIGAGVAGLGGLSYYLYNKNRKK